MFVVCLSSSQRSVAHPALVGGVSPDCVLIDYMLGDHALQELFSRNFEVFLKRIDRLLLTLGGQPLNNTPFPRSVNNFFQLFENCLARIIRARERVFIK